MKDFISRPITRLLQYELLLKSLLDETPQEHDDRVKIPQVLDVIKSIRNDTEAGVVSAKSKVELWRYNLYLIFKPGETAVCKFCSLWRLSLDDDLVGHELT